MEQLPLAIGIGLAVSLLFSELFGLAAGGMVVPGYIALAMSHPVAVAVTVVAGFATFAIVQALSSVIILYGKRRTVLMITLGYIIGALARTLLGEGFAHVTAGVAHEYTVVGYIIPGLIAIWFDRQGIIVTTATLLTAAVVVRLTLVLLAGLEIFS